MRLSEVHVTATLTLLIAAVLGNGLLFASHTGNWIITYVESVKSVSASRDMDGTTYAPLAPIVSVNGEPDIDDPDPTSLMFTVYESATSTLNGITYVPFETTIEEG